MNSRFRRTNPHHIPFSQYNGLLERSRTLDLISHTHFYISNRFSNFHRKRYIWFYYGRKAKRINPTTKCSSFFSNFFFPALQSFVDQFILRNIRFGIRSEIAFSQRFE